MSVHISHRSDLSGRRPVKVDGALVGSLRLVSRRHSGRMQILFYRPGDRDYFATFENTKDLRNRLPSILKSEAL